mmetsp:Transcript_67073/g.129722  ORF Transcript_67073/g.129722 Transcript_67073/m.129722 type:complete len:91 (-) Transcript_67073:605-877(-)
MSVSVKNFWKRFWDNFSGKEAETAARNIRKAFEQTGLDKIPEAECDKFFEECECEGFAEVGTMMTMRVFYSTMGCAWYTSWEIFRKKIGF